MNRIAHVFDEAIARTPRQHVASVRDAAGQAGRGAQREAAVVGVLVLTGAVWVTLAAVLMVGGRR